MSIKPKKSLGQNFLNDPNTIRKIVNTLKAKRNDQIIEIGPGTGALTDELTKSYSDLTVIEIDDRVVQILKEKLPNVRIIKRDVLKINWDEIVDEKKSTFIIGNLPYYITSQILFSVLDYNSLFESALFMIQKEVAQRIVAEPKTKDYGILSVQIQRMSTPKYEFTVSRNVFYPVPNVDSAIISLNFNKPSLQCSKKHFKLVVRTAFNQRRKKLRNALKSLLAKNADFQFDLNRRAEELTPQEFEDLTIILEESGILSN